MANTKFLGYTSEAALSLNMAFYLYFIAITAFLVAR